MQRDLGVTSLYVTHDQVEAMTLGDRLLVLHQGRPAQLATPMEGFERPADTYVAGFIGAPTMNFLPAELTRDGSAVALGSRLVLGLADGRRPGPDGTKLTVGIRPEHLAPGTGLEMAVDLVEPLGVGNTGSWASDRRSRPGARGEAGWAVSWRHTSDRGTAK